jgi:hypothetical protein
VTVARSDPRRREDGRDLSLTYSSISIRGFDFDLPNKPAPAIPASARTHPRGSEDIDVLQRPTTPTPAADSAKILFN